MVCLVPRRVPDAESFFPVPGWSCQVHRGTVIQGSVRIIPSQIREETADANAGSSPRIIGGGWSRDKVERNTGINSEVPRKVVSKSRSPVVNAAIAAVTSF